MSSATNSAPAAQSTPPVVPTLQRQPGQRNLVAALAQQTLAAAAAASTQNNGSASPATPVMTTFTSSQNL